MRMFSRKLRRLENRMDKVVEKTSLVFVDEILGMEEILDILADLTTIMNQIFEDTHRYPKYRVNFDLFARSRVLLRSAYVCLKTGNYGSVLCLLRAVLENNELMLFFHLRPSEIEGWATNPKWWRESENRVRNLRDRIYSILDMKDNKLVKVFNDLYGDMSLYSHPRSKGWKELKTKTDGKLVEILRFPMFDSNVVENLLRKMMFVTYQSLKVFEVTYLEYLSSNPKVNSKLQYAIELLYSLFSRFQLGSARV